MTKVKQPWEATSWEELEAILRRTTNGAEPLEYVKHVLEIKDRQRIRDKEREMKKRERLAYLKANPDVLPDHLR